MKIEELESGAKFIRKKEVGNYVYIKVSNLYSGVNPINAIRLEDGANCTVGLNEELETIIL